MPGQLNFRPIQSIRPIPNRPRGKEIIDPTAYPVILLDDISTKLTKLLNQSELNQRYLASILKELNDEADEGQEIVQDGTVSNTEYTFIETNQIRQGLKVKSFNLVNDGLNNIYWGWNVTKGGLQPSLDDVTSPTTRFRLLLPGDSGVKIIFNRKVIYNIALLGQGGSSTYRLWMVW